MTGKVLDIATVYPTAPQNDVEGAKKTIARLKSKGIPVALYDLEKEKVYLEYPDGHREYPN